MAKRVEVYRLDYEMDGNRDQSWTAYIAAYSSDEATRYLYTLLNTRRIIINSLSTECRLDAVTDPVRKKIAEPMLPKKSSDNPQKQAQKRSIVPKGE